jgi:uncharacterized membrane protein
MSAMLLFTAMGHFMFSEGMAMMIPDFIPFKLELVYLTGVFEIVSSIGLLLPKHKVITDWLLIAFFVLVLPANIYAALTKSIMNKLGLMVRMLPIYGSEFPCNCFFYHMGVFQQHHTK